MNSFSLPSFAKINLTLRILGKRADGFHELFTVFQTVSLQDLLTFSPAEGFILECGDESVPTDDRNLIVKAAGLMRDRFSVSRGASVRLEKRIPSPGGLAGGSSNAAVALIGLARLWNLDATVEELLPLAAELGSDVPFFLYGGVAIGRGRGTDIEPVADIDLPYLLIVTPDVSVSTKEAFASINSQNLTSADAKSILIVCRFSADELYSKRPGLVNDMERAVFAAYPEIERAKRALLDLGAVNAMMSGSGASVFAVFENEETRQTALKALDTEVNWRKFAVAAVSRREYRGKLGITD